MENIEKCLAIAINELGKLNFSGGALIPAGKAMNALYLAAQEVDRLKSETTEKKKDNEVTDDGKN